MFETVCIFPYIKERVSKPKCKKVLMVENHLTFQNINAYLQGIFTPLHNLIICYLFVLILSNDTNSCSELSKILYGNKHE